MTTSNKSTEQIPDVLKKLAKEQPDESGIGSNGESKEIQAAANSRERWREMAQKVQQEQDPKKMIAMIEQLIAAFDKEKTYKRQAGTQNAGKRSD